MQLHRAHAQEAGPAASYLFLGVNIVSGCFTFAFACILQVLLSEHILLLFLENIRSDVF